MSGEPSRDRFDDRPALDARRKRVANRASEPGVHRSPDQVRADRRRHDQRADVPDRMTPALIELVGLDDDIGQLGARRSVGHRDQRGPCPGLASRRKGGVGRGRRRLRARCRSRGRSTADRATAPTLAPRPVRAARQTSRSADPPSEPHRAGSPRPRWPRSPTCRSRSGRPARRRGSCAGSAGPARPRRCRAPRGARGSAPRSRARPRSSRSCGTAAAARLLGIDVDSHGSGGPGSGAVGSNGVSSMPRSIRAQVAGLGHIPTDATNARTRENGRLATNVERARGCGGHACRSA